MPADAPALDLDHVRSRFPAFAQPAWQGWVHAENAGGSFPSVDTIEHLTSFYRERKVQPGHPSPAAQGGAAAMAAARAAMATWLGVEDDELQVGPSTTQNTYVLAQAFRSTLRPGDAVVVTEQDHEANSGAWRRLADDGVEVREWRVDPTTGMLDPAGLADLLDSHVRVAAFPHVSNIVGHPNPVAALTAMVREAGGVSVVDGVAAAPHGLPDVPALGADVYLFSTYKTYGPHQGVMTVRRELLERLPDQGHHFNAHLPSKRLVPAGPDHAQVAAMAGVTDHLEAVAAHHGGADLDLAGRRALVGDLFHAHEAGLVAPLLAWAEGRDDVRLLGPPDPGHHVPTVSLVCSRPGQALAEALVAHRVGAAGGHFYAHRLMPAVGVDPDHGVLRVSLAHYTSPAEVSQVVDALDAVV